MAKGVTAFELTLPPRGAGEPAYRWLYASLRAEILAGRLRPGSRLPGTRHLARQYGLSRGTLVNAFEQLAAEGYVEGSVGSGTRVSAVLPEELLHAPRLAGARAPERPRPPRRLSGWGQRVGAFPAYEARPTRAFRTDLPALDLFPTVLWTQVAARRLRRASTGLLLGCPALGYPPLRQAVADYLGAARGVEATPEQIAIVSGAQEALDLAVRLLVDPGDRVGIEDPGYIGATLVLEAAGARLCPLPVDEEGMRLPGPRQRGLRLVYVTPAHQFPLGTTMSLARRLALLEWARGAGALVFEDDYDSEFRYSGRPVPALQGLDASGQALSASGQALSASSQALSASSQTAGGRWHGRACSSASPRSTAARSSAASPPSPRPWRSDYQASSRRPSTCSKWRSRVARVRPC